MLFTEAIFAFFLFITFLFFWLSKKSLNAQLILLLAASYIFYAWWKVPFLSLIIFSSLLDFFLGKAIYRTDIKKRRKLYLYLSLAGNLGLLGYFKYAGFFIESVASVLSGIGLDAHLPTLHIVLPVGISFYTFQSLSYTLDIYYRRIKPTSSLLKFLFFVAAFPQLVAGPIVRASEFLPQLNSNLFKKCNDEGLFYIFYGLVKKLLIADFLGYLFVDAMFAAPQDYTSVELLFGLCCYAFQIFFDFSAYSDIAIGLGKLFGLELPVNFLYPYTAKNLTEFWRKWHITLSTWVRDYLYMPTVMKRIKWGNWATLYAVMISYFLIGLWHGANWNFIIFGLLHGVVICYEAFTKKRRTAISKRMPSFVHQNLGILLTFSFWCFTLIFFRAGTLGNSMDYLNGIGQFSMGFSHFSFSIGALMLFIAVFVHYFCEPNLKRISKVFTDFHWTVRAVIFYGFFVLLSYLGEQGLSHEAFIYFQF